MSRPLLRIPAFRLHRWRGRLVHVEGWHHGRQFIYLRSGNGMHVLRTPKTKRIVQTTNALCYTRKDEDWYGDMPLTWDDLK